MLLRLLTGFASPLLVESTTGKADFYHPVENAKSYHYPGTDLVWTTCGHFGNRTMECSRLNVPMDQFDLSVSENRSFSIPIARLLSSMPTAPTLIINNGGPGESGIDFIFKSADQLSLLFPDISEGLSLLAFDPRGVNNSIPAASCYSDSESRYLSPNWLTDWSNYEQLPGLLQAKAQNYARACRRVTGEYGAYMTTPQTAADINSILDAIGQRSLIFYGWSYGTILGQTYAQYYPTRVSKMILDGLWDSSYYHAVPDQTRRLASTDQAYSEFIQECFFAGVDCPLSQGYGSAITLERNLTNALLDLRDHPKAVFINASMYGELTYTDVTATGIWSSLYEPTSWPKLAGLLRKFMLGDYAEPFLEWTVITRNDIDACVQEPNHFISFNDAASRQTPARDRMNIDALKNASRVFSKASIIAGDTYSQNVFVSDSWEYTQIRTFESRTKITTPEPILLLSTRTDPITPLKMAQTVNEVFNGSVLVVQNSTGHTTISKPSLCTIKKTWLYLYENELPVNGTICSSETKYFPRLGPGLSSISDYSIQAKETNIAQEGRPHASEIDAALWSYQMHSMPLTIRTKSKSRGMVV